MLKRNRRRLHDGFVNGALARVESVHANGAGKVTSVVVSLLDEGASGARVRVQREELQARAFGDDYIRTTLPLVAAHAMTVHRVQGATLSGPVHILLNKEFFAEGQAYVALSRVRRLSQLHLWCLERTAIVASPLMVAQYERLHARGELSRAHVDAAPDRARVRELMPLAAP